MSTFTQWWFCPARKVFCYPRSTYLIQHSLYSFFLLLSDNSAALQGFCMVRYNEEVLCVCTSCTPKPRFLVQLYGKILWSDIMRAPLVVPRQNRDFWYNSTVKYYGERYWMLCIMRPPLVATPRSAPEPHPPSSCASPAARTEPPSHLHTRTSFFFMTTAA